MCFEGARISILNFLRLLNIENLTKFQNLKKIIVSKNILLRKIYAQYIRCNFVATRKQNRGKQRKTEHQIIF